MHLHGISCPEKEIIEFCNSHKIKEFALFGSILTDHFRPDSDIDILVTFEEDCEYSLFDLAQIQQELEAIFGRSIDLVEKESLRNPFRKHEILNNMEVLYAA